jgi:tetrahydromethanopterin S-methyltransferase subunit F
MFMAAKGKPLAPVAIVINATMIAIATGVSIASGHRQQSSRAYWSGVVGGCTIRMHVGPLPAVKGIGMWIIPTLTRLSEWTGLSGPPQQLLRKDVRAILESRKDAKVGQVVETSGTGIGSERVAWVPIHSPKQKVKATDLVGAYRAGLRLARKHNLTAGLLVGGIAGISIEQNVDAIVTVLQSIDDNSQLVLNSPDATILEKVKEKLALHPLGAPVSGTRADDDVG